MFKRMFEREKKLCDNDETMKTNRERSGEMDREVQQTVGRDQFEDVARPRETGCHGDATMLVINPLVSACLGGQILTV